MILYNVTMNVDNTVHEEWIGWMKNEYIPSLMNTGLFVEYKFLRMISEVGEEQIDTGTTYAVQYYLKNIEDFLNYIENFAPGLQQKILEKYGKQVLVFRTLLEVID